MRLLLCLSLLLLVSPGRQERPLLVVETDKVKGVICTERAEWEFMLKGKGFWTPTKEQALEAEAEIEKFLERRPPAASPELWRKLTRYKRQYVGFTSDGRRYVFCNFYCSDEPLTTKPVLYDDGGDCFFQVVYDVEGRKVSRLEINGDA